MVAKQLALGAHRNYVNQMDREEQSAVQRAYGAKYARLREAKTRYDPQNMFRYDQNVLPLR
jgi:Berberine and berberine like